MQKKFFLFTILVFFFLLIFSGCRQVEETIKKEIAEEILIGYCPTMSIYLDRITSENIIKREYSSAAEALSYLKRGDIDAVIIGRKAKQYELNTDAREYVLGEGYTLISNTKQSISYYDLDNIEIHTHLSPEESFGILLENHNVVYHDSLEESLYNMGNNAALINWDEFRDDFELLIPMKGNLKAEEFRIPVLYANDIGEETIREIISFIVE